MKSEIMFYSQNTKILQACSATKRNRAKGTAISRALAASSAVPKILWPLGKKR
jgi:hypothetical protein